MVSRYLFGNVTSPGLFAGDFDEYRRSAVVVVYMTVALRVKQLVAPSGTHGCDRPQGRAQRRISRRIHRPTAAILFTRSFQAWKYCLGPFALVIVVEGIDDIPEIVADLSPRALGEWENE